MSSISVMKLEHGWRRANTPEAAAERRRYLDEVLAILPVEPFTREMGVLAAKIDADSTVTIGNRCKRLNTKRSSWRRCASLLTNFLSPPPLLTASNRKRRPSIGAAFVLAGK